MQQHQQRQEVQVHQSMVPRGNANPPPRPRQRQAPSKQSHDGGNVELKSSDGPPCSKTRLIAAEAAPPATQEQLMRIENAKSLTDKTANSAPKISASSALNNVRKMSVTDLGSVVDFGGGEEAADEDQMSYLSYEQPTLNVDQMHFENLSSEEIAKIYSVLKRDREVNSVERERVKLINKEIDLKSAQLEPGSDRGIKICINCDANLSSPGVKSFICNECFLKSCAECTVFLQRNNYCKLCQIKMIHDGKSGVWFKQMTKNAERFRKAASVVMATSIRSYLSSAKSPAKNHIDLSTTLPQPVTSSADLLEPVKAQIVEEQPPAEITAVITEKATGDFAEPIKSTPKVYQKNDQKAILEKKAYSTGDLTNKKFESDEKPARRNSKLKSMDNIYIKDRKNYRSSLSIVGQVCFSLSYDHILGQLDIYIDRCKNATIANRKLGKTDGYIKVYFYYPMAPPVKKKTKVIRDNLSPIYRQTLVFKITQQELVNATISIAFWHNQVFGHNLFLGEVLVDCDEINWQTGTELAWYPFANRDLTNFDKKNHKKRSNIQATSTSNLKNNKNSIVLSFQMKFISDSENPGNGDILVNFLKIQGFITKKIVDLFLKTCLIEKDYQTSLQSEQQSKIIKYSSENGESTDFRAKFIIEDVNQNNFHKLSLQISLHKKVSSKISSLGIVRLNTGSGLYENSEVPWMDANEREQGMWSKFIESPNGWTFDTLLLRNG